MAEKNYGNNSQLAELVKYISDEMKFPIMGAGGGFAPIGTINFFDATTAPLGWLACDGSIHNISDYPDLATFYASHHGASNFYGGNGTTTFAVPNLQGEFLRGAGTNGHANQGNGGSVGEHQDGTKSEFILGDQGYFVGANDNLRAENANADKIINSSKEVYTQGNSRSSLQQGVYITSRPTNTSFLICVKATVSGDANAHQYSTEEQIVGMTEDGKVIYEKTITGLSAATTWSQQYEARVTISFATLGLSNIDFVRSATAYGTYQSGKYMYPASAVVDGTNITFGVHNAFTISKLTIQYTKTSS